MKSHKKCGTTFCGNTRAMPQRGQDRSLKRAEGEVTILVQKTWISAEDWHPCKIDVHLRALETNDFIEHIRRE